MVSHPRPLLLVDQTNETYAAVQCALNRIGGWLPLLLIPQPAAVRQFLRESAKAGRIPIAVLVRLPEHRGGIHDLVEWVFTQPEPICSVDVLPITDAIAVACDGSLDRWIEEAVRTALRKAHNTGAGDRSTPTVRPEE
jgi:hypothetical protein